MTQVGEGPEAASRPVMTFGAPTLGEILADRYRLEEHVNEDSFGRQMWRAVDVVLRRPVAVILRYPGGDSAAEMLRSAVTASRVAHANFMGVYDAIDEGHRAYVVREWVDGVSLRDYVTEHPLPASRATTVGHAVASAVAAVHATGVAHGNIHPGTVLIGAEGRVVLADARIGEDVTVEADIRAIGGILYFSLTGRWPHAEVPAPERHDLPDAVRDADGNLTPPQQATAGAPAHLATLTMDLLDQSQALPTAEVLAAELGRLDAEAEFEAAMDGGYFDGDSPVPFGAGSVTEAHRPAGRKMLVGVLALLLVAATGLFLATQLLSGGDAGGGQTGQGGVASPPSTSGGQTTGNTNPLKLSADRVRVVDPKGDGTELAGADKTVDGNLDTIWKTDQYNNNAKFGLLKDGMGILIDLGEARKVQVEVVFDLAGTSAELRTGTVNPSPGPTGDGEVISSYEVKQRHAEHNGTKMVFNTLEEPARYLLVWITSLPKVDDGPPPHFQVGVQEIFVYPR